MNDKVLPADLPAHDGGLTLDDFDYELPEALIARHPPARRGASRLLRVCAGRAPVDDDFDALPGCFEAGDVLVLNDTRVIPTRLSGRKDSGGRIEAMIERVTGETTAIAMLRASHFPPPGTALRFDDGASGQARAVVGARPVDAHGRPGRMVELSFDRPVLALLERIGSLPLPPYLDRAADATDDERYQTVYARAPGAAAAPTAGLHFSEPLLQRLRERGVTVAPLTLHVGAGTFLPVTSHRIDAHVMHAERFDIPPATADAIARARAAGRRITAVGTTSLRALEASSARAGPGETSIYIRPGHRFTVVDRLLTNFHLPRSTLLILVSAFAGIDTIRTAYRHAIAHEYRFFSYGDAMLLEHAR